MSEVLCGIDPGAKYTGVSIIDADTHEVLLSSTYVRPDDAELFAWAYKLGDLIQQDVISLYPQALIGIEGVSAPKGHINGRKSPINPKYLIFAAVVAGALAQRFGHTAVIIPPGHNGTSRSGYPSVLEGRRPKELPGNAKGAGTRNHERSAFDVAKSVPIFRKNFHRLDTKTALFFETVEEIQEITVTKKITKKVTKPAVVKTKKVETFDYVPR